MIEKDAGKFLIKKGCRSTKSRKAVIEILEESETPMTAENIFLKIKELGFTTNLSTIYRNLELMESVGLVEKTTVLNDSKSRYELVRKGHRHHIICTACRKMVPLDSCPFQKYETDIENETKFDITGHQFILYGLCPECKKSQE